jgi:hypothetical protein
MELKAHASGQDYRGSRIHRFVVGWRPLVAIRDYFR